MSDQPRTEPQSLHLSINGEPHEVPGRTTVATLLVHLGLDARQVAVERNRKLVRKADFAATPLADGDELEVVTFFGGG